jgi:hypothetical protein
MISGRIGSLKKKKLKAFFILFYFILVQHKYWAIIILEATSTIFSNEHLIIPP